MKPGVVSGFGWLLGVSPAIHLFSPVAAHIAPGWIEHDIVLSVLNQNTSKTVLIRGIALKIKSNVFHGVRSGPVLELSYSHRYILFTPDVGIVREPSIYKWSCITSPPWMLWVPAQDCTASLHFFAARFPLGFVTHHAIVFT